MSGLIEGRHRPAVKLPWKPYEVLIEALALAGLLAGICLVVIYWPSLPAVMPQHIGVSGTVDAWNTKQYMALFFTGVTLAMYLLLTIASLFPGWYNYPVKITDANAAYVYRLGRNLMQWLKVGITWLQVTVELQFFELGMGRETISFAMVLLLEAVVLLVPILYFLVRMMQPPSPGSLN